MKWLSKRGACDDAQQSIPGPGRPRSAWLYLFDVQQQAGTVLVFGQTGISNDFSATNNGNKGIAGGTTLSAIDIPVTITGIDADASMPGSFPDAFFNLTATSDSNARTGSSGHITQDFSGSFSITSLADGGGVNYLSGTFHDAVFGEGTGLVMTSSGPQGVTSFTSDVIGALGQSLTLSLSFANVTPSASVTCRTLDAFTASVSGSFSAAVPEPDSLALLAIGMSGLFVLRWRFRRTEVA